MRCMNSSRTFMTLPPAIRRERRFAIERPNPYGWNISGHHGTVVLHYIVFGDHADGTYAGIDETHAHMNLPAVLVWARGFENAPSTLTFECAPGLRLACRYATGSAAEWNVVRAEFGMADG